MAQKTYSNVNRLSLFERPLASGKAPEKFTFYNYLTFRNIVVGLGIVALLVFLANAVSGRVAFMTGALIAFALLVLAEMASRRRWEKDILEQLQHMGRDYDRLVRDVARNRNDTALLRKDLSVAAATVARSYDRSTDEQIDQRILKGLIDQLAKLDTLPAADQEEIDIIPEEDLGITEGADPEKIGLHLTETQVLQLVQNATRQDRVDLFLQPIVGLPQRKVRFYEMLSRIRIKPETHLPASRYIGIARRQELIPIIDNLLLLRGLQIIRKSEENNAGNAFFFNITSPTLNDPKFMGDLVEFISLNRTLAPRLVFELAQTDIAGMSADVLPILDGLSKLGCRFSMDQVHALKFNLEQLESRHVRFIKVEAAVLVREIRDDSGLQRLKRLKDEFDRNGIDLIVEKIETERQLLEILEIDVDYGQGYLFGKPALYEKK